MPLPKYKQSRSNTRARRAEWRKDLKAPNLVECPHCRQVKMAHRACTKCGYYKGRNVIATKVEG